MTRAGLAFAVLLNLILLAGLASGVAAKQLAIVIGNDTYAEIIPLTAAVNDARAISQGLRQAGFAVDVVENGTKRQMSRALAAIETRIEPGDTVVFHFSGHGFEIDGQNWLLPIDVPAAREGEAGLVKDESFNAADIIERFRARGAGTVVAILDACRNNPFPRTGTRALGGTRGLARMDAAGGVFILFSAGSKQEALDKLSPSDPALTSIFVRSVLPLIGRPELSLIDIAKETQDKVRSLARSVGHEQIPAYYDGIVGRVTLTGALPSNQVASVRLPDETAATQARNAIAEEIFWRSIADSRQPAMFEAYLEQVRTNRFSGTYRKLAETKLAALQAKPQEPTPAPNAPAGQERRLVAPSEPDLAAVPDTANVAACDAAAADPRDPDKPAGAAGVETVPAGAVEASACARAARENGAPRRVFYQLSRSYEAAANEINAVAFLQRGADLGHALALSMLADRHLAGRGVPRDEARAMALYYKAADGGVAAAIVKIGGLYASGRGAQRDYKKAVALYNLALKAEEPSVYPELAQLYLTGRGVAKDRRKACDLFRQGAKRGNAAAARSVSSHCGPG